MAESFETHITPEQWKQIADACSAAYPNEACGLFVGRAWDAAELVAMENLMDRYHGLDPDAFPRTARTAYMMHAQKLNAHVERAGGLLAIWHSHCEVGAYFSEEDVRAALGGGHTPLWPGTSYIVMSVRNRLVDGGKWFDWDAVRGTFEGRALPLPRLA